MKHHDKLTDSNFLVYAAKHYDKTAVDDQEFFEDLKRIKYLKKNLTRYELTGELKERLILNHLIILCNVFGPEPLSKLIFLKMRSQLHLVKPFMVLLNIWPDLVYNVGKDGVQYGDEIPLDQGVVERLRNISNA
jgi:hypothetical protein